MLAPKQSYLEGGGYLDIERYRNRYCTQLQKTTTSCIFASLSNCKCYRTQHQKWTTVPSRDRDLIHLIKISELGSSVSTIKIPLYKLHTLSMSIYSFTWNGLQLGSPILYCNDRISQSLLSKIAHVTNISRKNPRKNKNIRIARPTLGG